MRPNNGILEYHDLPVPFRTRAGTSSFDNRHDWKEIHPLAFLLDRERARTSRYVAVWADRHWAPIIWNSPIEACSMSFEGGSPFASRSFLRPTGWWPPKTSFGPVRNVH